MVTISVQQLQRACPQMMLPVLVGGAGVFSFGRTSRSLRFFSRLNATTGGFLGGLASVWMRCGELTGVSLPSLSGWCGWSD